MEVPMTIDISVNEKYTLTIPSLGTAGYIWNYKVLENDCLVNVLERTVDDLRTDVENQSTSVGSSKDEIFTIVATKTGHCKVHFTQKRLWEHNLPPLKEYFVEINVK